MPDNTTSMVLVFLSGIVASAVNAVAGGGTLVSFPTLMAVGLSEKVANATNAVALWPGSASGALGFHQYFQESKPMLKALLPPSIVGSVIGSFLLAYTSPDAFRKLVPFLVFAASVLLALQPIIKRKAQEKHGGLPLTLVIGLQFLVSVYGGYFGAGMGIMMLAVMALYQDSTMHQLNALKNWLAVVINFGASIVLVSKGLVAFQPALVLMAGALIGGFASAKISHKVDSEALRKGIVVYGFVMVVYLAWKMWS